MKTIDREEYMLNRLEQEKILHVSDLVESLHISEATVRRDLQSLEARGKIHRIPGGAIKPFNGSIVTNDDEVSMHERMHIHYEEKRKTALLAAKYVNDGDCVFLDGGSSIVPLIDSLKDRPIRIITHNNLLISRLPGDFKAEIITIGGTYCKEYAMSLGTDAIHQVENYCYDKAFISCVAYDVKEGMTYTVEKESREIKSAAIRCSQKAYLLVDHSKENLHAFCKFQPLDSFEKVFSDRRSPETDYPVNFEFAE